MKNWTNLEEWTRDIPIGFLPFFVWCEAKNVTHKTDAFEEVYKDFLKAELGSGIKDNDKFKNWCLEQYMHHYECSH